MAWLASLDARARRWPRVLHWGYLALKWYLVLVGAYLAVALAGRELATRRIGLGLGITAALLLAAIKGVAQAVAQHRH